MIKSINSLGYYSKELIDLIKFSEEILVNYSSLNELEKIKNESNQLIFENEKFLKNIDLAKQQIVLLEKLLAKNLKNKKKSSIIRQIDDLKFKIKINDPKEIIITLKNSSKLIDELSSNDEKINLKTNLYNFVLQSKWTTPGIPCDFQGGDFKEFNEKIGSITTINGSNLNELENYNEGKSKGRIIKVSNTEFEVYKEFISKRGDIYNKYIGDGGIISSFKFNYKIIDKNLIKESLQLQKILNFEKLPEVKYVTKISDSYNDRVRCR